MSKYFITGGSGFISSHFHDVIPQEDIINFDLRPPMKEIKSKYVKGDVRSFEELDEALKSNPCNIIIALAAEHKDFGISDEAYFLTNEKGTENICNAATENNIDSIIFYSSVAVYGNNTKPSTEAMLTNPNLPYGASKLAGEKKLHNWADQDPKRKVLILRPVVIYGERNVANMFRLIQQINKGRYFNIGKGENIKSIAYVKNIVEATLFLANRMPFGVSIYNYADDPQLTSRQIGMEISNELNKGKSITIPYKLAILLGLPFDLLIKLTGKDLPISTNRIHKFCTETYHKAERLSASGFIPKYSNVDGLRRMVDWQKNEYDKNEEYFNV